LATENTDGLIFDFHDQARPLDFKITFSNFLYGDIINEFVLQNGKRAIGTEIECNNIVSNYMLLSIKPENLRSLYFLIYRIIIKGYDLA
jgi:hypothetical protein